MQRNIFIDTDNDIFIQKGQRKLTQFKKHSLESFHSVTVVELKIKFWLDISHA